MWSEKKDMLWNNENKSKQAWMLFPELSLAIEGYPHSFNRTVSFISKLLFVTTSTILFSMLVDFPMDLCYKASSIETKIKLSLPMLFMPFWSEHTSLNSRYRFMWQRALFVFWNKFSYWVLEDLFFLICIKFLKL